MAKRVTEGYGIIIIIIIIIDTVQISKRVCGTDTYTITYSYVK